MQLHNAAVSLDAPLRYPPNLVLPLEAPGTKKELLLLSGMFLTRHLPVILTMSNPIVTDSIAVAQVLNLPALPDDATLAQRYQQIMEHLGCGT